MRVQQNILEIQNAKKKTRCLKSDTCARKTLVRKRDTIFKQKQKFNFT